MTLQSYLYGLTTGFRIYYHVRSNGAVNTQRRCRISYLKRLRDLNRQFALEQDPIKRQQIIEQVLFLIETRSLVRKADRESPLNLNSISLLSDDDEPGEQES